MSISNFPAVRCAYTALVATDSLKPNPVNPNRHDSSQLALYAKIIRHQGWRKAITVSRQTGFIVTGHGAWQTAKAEGWPEVPIDGQDFASQADETAHLLADNKLPQLADLDLSEVAKLIDGLGPSIDLDLTGYSGGDLDQCLAALNGEPELDAEPQIDRAAELQKEWGTKLGQVWRLGEHRLMCGDSTRQKDVGRLVEEESAELLFSSPPYSEMREYSGNDVSIDCLTSIFKTWKGFAKYWAINLGMQFKGKEVFPYWDRWIAEAKSAGLKFLSWNVWDRLNATSVSSQTKMFAVQHEWVFVFGQSPKDLNRTWEKSPESQKREAYYSVNAAGQKVTTRRQVNGDVKESTIGIVYDNKNMGTVFTGYAEMERSIEHPAKFPVAFPIGYIGAMTDEGDYVADPFLGSGTTLIACEQLGRKCRGMEIYPGYVAVTLQRYKDATGKTPELLK